MSDAPTTVTGMAKKQQFSGIGRPLRRVQRHPDADVALHRWPATIPAVRQVLDDGLDLGRATVLVGDNGTGKSTLIEAIAEAHGLNPEGGSSGAMHRTRRTESDLSTHLQLVRGIGGARGGYFLRAETMHSFFTYLEENRAPDSPPDGFHARSHGESFLDLVSEKFFDWRGDPRPGLFVLDEPESALSFTSCLSLLALLQQLLAEPKAQVLMATHSPVLAALPGATILELDEAGLHPTPWQDVAVVVNQRAFLADPGRYLQTLT